VTLHGAPPSPPARAARRVPVAVLAGAIVAGIAAALVALALAGGGTLPQRSGPPIEELVVERTVLRPGTIELRVRNSGPDAVSVRQVFVNDVYVDFTSGRDRIRPLAGDTLRLDYPWQEGSPYVVSMLTSTGVVIEHRIAAAVQTPQGSAGLFGLMALLGVYVGVIPVIMGMLFLPVLRRARRQWIRGLLGLTVGLLAFLAVDATLEGLQLGQDSGGAFGGPELVFLGAGLAFLALTGLDRHLQARRARAGAMGAGGGQLALMVAIGIGLHNLGEGLAIGSAYAVGELALGAFLVVGFAAHNTTEGLAIVAPLTERRPPLLRLLGLGLIAGAPAILGAILGASVTNAELTALLLGVGVGAILQVIVQITPSLRGHAGKILDPATVTGIASGVMAMYVTGLLVTV